MYKFHEEKYQVATRFTNKTQDAAISRAKESGRKEFHEELQAMLRTICLFCFVY